MEDKLENFFKKYQDLKGMEDMTTTKIKSLEFDLKRQFLMRESLETENDSLAQENRELMEKCLKIERLNQDIIRKNTEIYSLEAKIQTLPVWSYTFSSFVYTRTGSATKFRVIQRCYHLILRQLRHNYTQI